MTIGTCKDDPEFRDKYDTSCQLTYFYGNCKDGKPAKISAADLRLDANSDGVSAMDACCGCYENYGSTFNTL